MGMEDFVVAKLGVNLGIGLGGSTCVAGGDTGDLEGSSWVSGWRFLRGVEVGTVVEGPSPTD